MSFFVNLKKTLKTIKEENIFYSYQRGMEMTQTNCVFSKYSRKVPGVYIIHMEHKKIKKKERRIRSGDVFFFFIWCVGIMHIRFFWLLLVIGRSLYDFFYWKHFKTSRLCERLPRPVGIRIFVRCHLVEEQLSKIEPGPLFILNSKS